MTTTNEPEEARDAAPHAAQHVFGQQLDARLRALRPMRGKFGEALCAHVLMCRGYEILERNYKVISGEVDIICCKECNLVFVEVKTWERYGEPDISRSVGALKLSRIKACADIYTADEQTARARTCVRIDVMLVAASRHKIIHYKGVL